MESIEVQFHMKSLSHGPKNIQFLVVNDQQQKCKTETRKQLEKRVV